MKKSTETCACAQNVVQAGGSFPRRLLTQEPVGKQTAYWTWRATVETAATGIKVTCRSSAYSCLPGLPARVNHPQVVQRQVLYGNAHGAPDPRGVGILELEAVAPALVRDKKIQFRAGVSGPEVNVPGVERADHLLRGE